MQLHLDKELCQKLKDLAYSSRTLLFQDALACGSWGRTIRRYTRLTQKANPELEKRTDIDNWGSITHTVHCVLGIKPILSNRAPELIELGNRFAEYLDTWSMKCGGIATPVTNWDQADIEPNPDNAKAVANIARHTASANTATSIFLDLLLHGESPVSVKLRSKRLATIRQLRERIAKSTSYLADCARFYEKHLTQRGDLFPSHYEYSIAYLIRGLLDAIKTVIDDKTIVVELKKLLIVCVNQLVGKTSDFFCEKSHPWACYFYEAIILESLTKVLTEIPSEYEAKVVQRIKKGIRSLYEIADPATKAIPIGLNNEDFFAEPGTTARTAIVALQILQKEGLNSETSDIVANLEKSIKWLAFYPELWRDSPYHFTHTWEAIGRLEQYLLYYPELSPSSTSKQLTNMLSSSMFDGSAPINRRKVLIDAIRSFSNLEPSDIPIHISVSEVERLLLELSGDKVRELADSLGAQYPERASVVLLAKILLKTHDFGRSYEDEYTRAWEYIVRIELCIRRLITQRFGYEKVRQLLEHHDNKDNEERLVWNKAYFIDLIHIVSENAHSLFPGKPEDFVKWLCNELNSVNEVRNWVAHLKTSATWESLPEEKVKFLAQNGRKLLELIERQIAKSVHKID